MGPKYKSGIALDSGYIEALGKELEEEILQLEQEIYKESGEEFNLNSPKQLSEILFIKKGITPIKKTKTGFSTNEDVLQQLAPLHPIAKLILRYRKLYKLKHTYVDVLPTLVNEVTGRIHTSFNQAVAATGRLSSSVPNLQNIPIKDELGRKVRSSFVAEKGNVLISADYSQIELRVLAALSEDDALLDAYQTGEDIHKRTAASIFNIEEDEVDREKRNIAKTVNFGVIYGLSAFGLARDLSISRTEAQQFIDAYFSLYNGVLAFTEEVVEEAEEKGYVRTWFGRLRHIPELASKNRMTRSFGERMAVNTRIQGTAADLIKLAMINVNTRIREEGLTGRMLLQVHDELLFEVPEKEVPIFTKIIEEEMKQPWPFEIPVEVGIGSGPNWQEAH